MDILAVYYRYTFQDCEGFLTTELDLVEDDIRLILDEYNSKFIIYVLEPGIYICKCSSETRLKILRPEYPGYHNANDIEFNNITVKLNLAVRPGIIAIRFDEKSFFSTILGFTPHWDYKKL